MTIDNKNLIWLGILSGINSFIVQSIPWLYGIKPWLQTYPIIGILSWVRFALLFILISGYLSYSIIKKRKLHISIAILIIIIFQIILVLIIYR